MFEGLLLLIIVLPLAACAPSSGDDWNGEPGSEDPVVTAPADITVAATNAGGTAATDPAIAAFLNGANAADLADGPIATINNDVAFQISASRINA
ncbi:MAG: hypothetical protein GY792_06095 [Gammaproteobacteria bacterium]|nr:hypothetical protein [Gammaproteobacteria bacterium]